MSLLRELHRGGWIRAIDHALAMSLSRLDPDTPDAVLAAIALASRAVANGHGCLRIDNVVALLDEIAPERPPPILPARDAWLQLLRDSRWVGVAAAGTDTTDEGDADDRFHGMPLVLERGGLFLRRYRDYEWRLAHALRARTAIASVQVFDDELSARLRELFPNADGVLDAQALAALQALSSQLSLVTGGPGTGKTSTIARVLVLLVEQARQAGREPPRIALAAPTGKAAARLGEVLRENLAALLAQGVISPDIAAAIPTEAQTLHRLLGWRSDSINFHHDAEFPLAADVVIVDEASMVDLPLMTKLVEAVALDARLILLGDRDQLASVETGDVLAALCDAAGDGRAFPPSFAGLAQELLGAAVPTAPDPGRSALAGHRVDLQRSYRQAASVNLAPLAAAVREGDADAVIAGLQAQRYAGVQWHPHDPHGLAGFLRDHALPQFRQLAQAASPQQALLLAREYRILTALRSGATGNQTLNAWIAAALQPRRDHAHFHGQLLLVTENSYRQGLFNGDTGVAWHDDDGLRVWFDTAGGPRAWLPSQLPAHESAWALTVHKAQGSEFGKVVLVLPEHDARVLSRELVYTGITRCRLGLDIHAPESVLRAAIGRRGRRESGLAERFTLPAHPHGDTASR